MLPALDANGFLPPGRHRATMDEVYARFVEDAPFREERQLVFDALTTYTALVRRTYRKGAFWMDGGFVKNHAELREVDRTWSSVRDRTGSVVPGRVKGYVEVAW